MSLPATNDPSSPADIDSPAQGASRIRGIKNYLVDVLGVPNNVAVTAAPMSISAAGVMSILQSPLTVPTLIQGGLSQILRIESQYSNLVFGINGASVMGLSATGMLMQKSFNEWPSGVTGFLGTQGAQPLALRTNALNRLTVASGGNIGIGTVVPTLLLDIAGSANVQTNLVVSGTVRIDGNAILTNAGAATLTLPTATDTLVGRATTDTLTNKTFTSPTFTSPSFSTIVNTGTLTLPTSTDTLVGRATTDTLTNKTLTAPVVSSISNGGTISFPSGTDTLVGKATTDTLTNKTLTAPVISSISNGGTISFPSGTDTLVGKATTDTLTNKTLTTPTIGDFSNATHSHQNNAGGGALSTAALTSGTMATARLGSGSATSSTFLRGDSSWATPTAGSFTSEFVSSDQTITLGSALNVAHGLGSKPKLILATVKCITADQGYSINDEVPLNPGDSGTSGATSVFDATNVTILTGSSNVIIRHKTGFNAVAITTTSWRYVVRAWL